MTSATLFMMARRARIVYFCKFGHGSKIRKFALQFKTTTNEENNRLVGSKQARGFFVVGQICKSDRQFCKIALQKRRAVSGVFVLFQICCSHL